MTGEQVFYDDVGVGDQMPTLTVTVDETQLFFFSAATYNGHRIHYDKEWARTVEGYDDLLVQGPLQAACWPARSAIGSAGAVVWCLSRCRTGPSRIPASCSASVGKSPESASPTTAPAWWISKSPAAVTPPC